MRDYPNLKIQDKGIGQTQASFSSDAPKKTASMLLALKVTKRLLPTW